MKVTIRKIAELKQYENNPRHNEKAVQGVAESIKQFGWQQPIVVDKDGVIIAGHTRYKAAQSLGLNEVPVVIASDLTPDQVKAYRILDNKLNEIAEWDLPKLGEEIASIPSFDFGSFGFSMEDFFGAEKSDETVYNTSIKGPIYEPQGKCPEPTELYDLTKFKELTEALERSDLPLPIKGFLRLAAYRHIVFDYQNIAEFYAHASPEVQRLMEDSALVIIDFQKAIENGFVDLTNEVAESYLSNVVISSESDDE